MTTSDKIELYASCLQTSASTSDPDVVTGTLIIKNVSNTEEAENLVDIVQMHCTCKASSSHSCKHIVAVLLFRNRYEPFLYTTQWLNNLNKKYETRKIYITMYKYIDSRNSLAVVLGYFSET